MKNMEATFVIDLVLLKTKKIAHFVKLCISKLETFYLIKFATRNLHFNENISSGTEFRNRQ